MLPRQHPEWKMKYQTLFNRGDIFLVEGSHMKQCLIKLGCPDEKIIVQHIGIDTDNIKYNPRVISGDGEIKILISASFREKKGIPYAVKAFGIVKKNHPDIKLQLTIIGDSSGSSEENKIKSEILNIIDEYSLNDCTRMLGYQPHSIFIKELYAHHIFLHPSVHASNGDTEGGSPVSITEASASGMPILSTTHCDIPEVVINNQSGFLVPEKDISALTEKLEHLILNPQLWQEMGLCGRNHIEQNYNLKEQVKKLEDTYDRVLTSS